MNRRAFMQMLAAASLAGAVETGTAEPLLAAPEPKPRLVVHRGGVVDETHPENSPVSLEAGIARGYWMVEVDVRKTRDGHAILQHDSNFKRFYGEPRKVSEMDWAEIKQLRATPGGSRPMEFHELAERCKGRMRLMLDVKEEPHPPEFYRIIQSALEKNDLMDSTYILSGSDAENFFRGKLPAAADAQALRDAVARGEDVSRGYYIFEWARTISPETIAFAREHHVDVIAEANTFQYKGPSAMDDARVDLQRAIGLGVTALQIDSVYDQWFQNK